MKPWTVTAESVKQVMATEFENWSAACAYRSRMTQPQQQDGKGLYPHPCEPGGLPEGWQVRGVIDQHTTHDKQTVVDDAVVIERVGGGWTMVFHWVETTGETKTAKWSHAGVTLEGLYAGTDPAVRKTWNFERNLHDWVVSHYDLTDEAEAAEVTLIGLGAPITVFPRALTKE